MEIAFNERRALEVFRIVNRAWQNREGIFKNAVLSQNLKDMSWLNHQQRANFLFFCSPFMRGGVNSDTQFNWLNKAFEIFPEIFDPGYIAQSCNQLALKDMLRKIGLEVFDERPGKIMREGTKNFGPMAEKINEYVDSWIHNAQILHSSWKGDIRNVFDGLKDFEKIYDKIRRRKGNKRFFVGMERKIFALLTHWLQQESLIPFFPAPLAVDFQDLRIIISTEMVDLKGSQLIKPFQSFSEKEKFLEGHWHIACGREKVLNSIMIWSEKFLSENGLVHYDIDAALWIMGRSLCARQFQSKSAQKGTVLNDSKRLAANEGLWPRKYSNPCAFCPLERFCRWIIPSSPFYNQGRIILIERVPYPQNVLPGLDWHLFGANSQKLKKRMP